MCDHVIGVRFSLLRGFGVLGSNLKKDKITLIFGYNCLFFIIFNIVTLYFFFQKCSFLYLSFSILQKLLGSDLDLICEQIFIYYKLSSLL